MKDTALVRVSTAEHLPELTSAGAWPRIPFGESPPLSWTGVMVSPSVLEHYMGWLAALGIDFDPAKDPWLPLGSAGPVLILGHHSPSQFEAWLPLPCFQPVELSRTDYEALLEQVGLVMRDLASKAQTAPKANRGLPGRFILPCSTRAALQFILEYFPQQDSERGRVAELCSQLQISSSQLPVGYALACERLASGRGLVDLRMARIVAPGLLPSGLHLPNTCVPVACHNRVLWLASESPLNPALEDRLLNELGDGWRLRVLLRVDVAETGHSTSEAAQAERPQPVRMGHPALNGLSSLAAAAKRGRAEIVLSEKDIAELDRYDPRRGVLDARRVFLKELSAAIRQGASDLHLEPGVETFRIRLRVDGLLEEWFEGSFEFGQLLVGAAKELLSMPAERYLPQDGSCVVRHGPDVVNIRISSFPIRKSAQKLVLRFLPRRGQVPALEKLLDPREARWLLKAARAPQGLVLVCGPTGSGKTTTVFSTLAAINTPERNILSLEDPVEYELEGISQAELDMARGVGWEQLLRAFLRQDPDAGMLGEIRDFDTAETAVRQALTGHVVFASLHTLSCAQTIERLSDLGLRADMLASSLTLVVSQRLVRKLCPRCRQGRRPDPGEQAIFERHGLPSPELVHEPDPAGCPSCRSGFKGRLAVLEMLPVTQEVAALISQKASPLAFVDWMRRQGFPSLFESALAKVARGETSMAEAREWQSVWEDFDFS